VRLTGLIELLLPSMHMRMFKDGDVILLSLLEQKPPVLNIYLLHRGLLDRIQHAWLYIVNTSGNTAQDANATAYFEHNAD